MTDVTLPDTPTVEVRWPRPHAAVVILRGEHDLNTASDLQETISLVLTGCSHLILDLSATEFIDSSTIALLMAAKRQSDERNVSFNVVLGPTSVATRVIEITQVGPALNVVPTVEQALPA